MINLEMKDYWPKNKKPTINNTQKWNPKTSFSKYIKTIKDRKLKAEVATELQVHSQKYKRKKKSHQDKKYSK